jgi:hypothetical protein
MEILIGDLSPRETGMRKKYSPQAFVGFPRESFFCRGDEDRELFPDGEFSVVIPRCGAFPRFLLTAGLIRFGTSRGPRPASQ